MPVSYLSKPYESNPYILPVDLNLLAKVNQYKQTMFYKNADSLKGQLGALKNTDIINQSQKARLDKAYNGVVNQINDAGAIDYSDMGIVNQVQNLGAQVYDDPYIMNGITSTRQLREYMGNSEKIKNDPKLNKFYDPAREAYDTQFFMKPYIDGGLDAKYEGPTAPAPYLGNDFDLLATGVTKLHPNIRTGIGPNGKYMYDIETNKELSRETIMSMVDGKIDGKVADQLNVHAWYNYDHLSGGTFTKENAISEYSGFAKAQLSNTNEQLTYLQSAIKTEPIASVREGLQAKIDELKGTEAKQYKDGQKFFYENSMANSTKYISDLWDKNKNAAYYTLYTNKMKDDIANTYTYSETKHVLVNNMNAIEENKLDIEIAKSAGKLKRDANGKIVATGATGEPPAVLNNLEPNLDTDLKGKEATLSNINNEISQTQDKLDESLLDMITKTVVDTGDKALDPLIGLTSDGGVPKININGQVGSNPTSLTGSLRGIAQSDGNSSLSVGDLELAIAAYHKNANETAKKQGLEVRFGADDQPKFYDKNGKEQNIDVKITNKNSPSFTLTAPQVKFFQNVIQTIDNASQGKVNSIDIKRKDDWVNYVNDYNIKQNFIQSKKDLITSAKDQLSSQNMSRLNAKDKALYDDYNQHPERYMTKSTATSYTDGNTVQTSDEAPGYYSDKNIKIRDIINMLNVDDASVNNLLKTTADRKNFYNVLLPDTNKDRTDIAPTMINYIKSAKQSNTIDNGSPTYKTLDIDKDENIAPIAVVTDGTDYYIKYSNKINAGAGFGYAPLDKSSAQKLGVQDIPHPELEEVLRVHKQLIKPLYISSGSNKDSPLNNIPVKIQILATSTGKNRNGDSYKAYMLYTDKKTNREIRVAIPQSENALGNYSLAVATKLIQDVVAQNQIKSLDQLVDVISTIN